MRTLACLPARTLSRHAHATDVTEHGCLTQVATTPAGPLNAKEASQKFTGVRGWGGAPFRPVQEGGVLGSRSISYERDEVTRACIPADNAPPPHTHTPGLVASTSELDHSAVARAVKNFS
jgi:hypothetical protein